VYWLDHVPSDDPGNGVTFILTVRLDAWPKVPVLVYALGLHVPAEWKDATRTPLEAFCMSLCLQTIDNV
jgi:hypothetical protein